jgi:bifunctional UDP-N-acetylglucosamine pyrophosphorylase/glucosamine-1-phosphate N-acetyltransferase
VKTACVILAAGEGTRMKSAMPKVLHPICGTTMLGSVLDTVRKLKPDRVVVIAGRHIDSIRKAVGNADISFAFQKEPKGTGHALLCARPALKDFDGTIVVMNGDTPLVTADTIRRFLKLHGKNGNALSVLSFRAERPDDYGRIVRDGSGRVTAIVEGRDADAAQKEIDEVNSGVYAFRLDALSLLGAIRINRAKGEYYLTDIVASAFRRGMKTSAYCIGSEMEFMGVNTAEELLAAMRLMNRNIVRKWAARGVRFLDPGSVYIEQGVSVGRDTFIYPNVYLEGETKIGRASKIFPNVRIVNSVVGNSALIKDSTVIENSRVRDRASVGPFAHLRPGSDVGLDAKVGNFVEMKKAVLGKSSKASHLTYLGDAVIGKAVNIGAGTITCNYDGEKKHLTTIGDNVFVGSDSQLVAPVIVGKGAYIGAGSTITNDVPPGALSLSRTEQKNIRDWAKKKRVEKEKDRKEKVRRKENGRRS